jgi:hypothetical protein
MPGFFSKVGTYLAGGANAMGSRTLKGAMYGAGTGGLYGAMSDDTSVLGGMMSGALMGGAGARYGGAGALAGAHTGRGIGFKASMGTYAKAFGGGVANMAKRDAMRLRVMGTSAVIKANRGYGKIKGMF